MSAELARVRARGHTVAVVKLDGRRTLRVTPALPDDDPDLVALRAAGSAVAAALRAEAKPAPQPVAHAELPAQPETAPRPGVAPRPAPDPDPVIYAMPPHVTRRLANGRTVVERDGILVTAAHVHAYLDERDDDALKDFLAGRISKRDAWEWTADWIRQYVGLTGFPPRIHRYF